MNMSKKKSAIIFGLTVSIVGLISILGAEKTFKYKYNQPILVCKELPTQTACWWQK